jgi:uncharacterized protein YcfJ
MREVVQKLGCGQRVDSTVSFGANGWETTPVSRFKPRFAPRVLPADGGGTVIEAKLPHNVSFLVRTTGSPGSNGIARVDKGATAFGKLDAAGNVIRPVARVLGAASTYAEQFSRDAERPDMEAFELHKRAAYRAASVTMTELAAGKAGTAGGAWVGGIVGTFFFPGPGTAAGSVIGGLTGGYFASQTAGKAANAIVDRTVDSVGQGSVAELRENLAEMAEDFGDFCNDAAEKILDTGRELGDWVTTSARRLFNSW